MRLFINKSNIIKIFAFIMITLATVLMISGCADEEDAWEAAKAEDTIESYEEFLKKYPDGDYLKEASAFLEKKYFQVAREEDTIDTYEFFLTRYPDSEHVEEILDSIEDLTWLKAEASDTVTGYEEYLEKYPNGKYATQALKAITPAIAKIGVTATSSTWREDEEPYDIESEVIRMLKESHFEIVADEYDARLVINYEEMRDNLREFVDMFGRDDREQGTIINCSFRLYEKDDLLFEKTILARNSSSFKITGSLYNAVYNDVLRNFKKQVYFTHIGDIIATKFGGTICGLEDELSVLLKAVEDDNVSGTAFKALGELEDPRVVEPLISLLEDKESVIRSGAAEALGRIGDERAAEPLMDLLDDNAPVVQSSAAEALGEIGDERAAEPLMDLLDDDSAGVRSSAAKALGEIGDSGAVALLINILDDEDSWVRMEAAEALGKLGDPRAVEPLMDLLDDESFSVQFEAEKAIRMLR